MYRKICFILLKNTVFYKEILKFYTENEVFHQKKIELCIENPFILLKKHCFYKELLKFYIENEVFYRRKNRNYVSKNPVSIFKKKTDSINKD